MVQRFIITLLLLMAGFIFYPTILYSQKLFANDKFVIQQYTEADGIVSSEVTGIYKDKLGFLWLTTFDGISRFDGHTFVNFNQNNGLPASNCDIIGEDEQQRLYLRSATKVFRSTGNSVEPFAAYPVNGKYIAAACPAGNDNIWVAYENSHELVLLSKSEILVKITTQKQVLSILKNEYGDILVTERNGQVSALRKNALQPWFTIVAKQPYLNEGIKIFKDPAGHVWTYGANNTQIYRWDKKTIVDSIAAPAGTALPALSVSSGKSVYIPTDSGSITQLINNKWHEILSRKFIKGPVFEIYEAADSIIWLAVSNGLYKVTRKLYSTVPASQPISYFKRDNHHIPILCRDSLLYTIPGAINAYRKLLPKTITYTYVADNKDVWYCTEEAVYVLKNGRLTQLNTANTYEGSKALFRFKKVLEDDFGGMWILSFHGLFYSKNGKLDYFFYKEGLKEGALYSIAIDDKGIIYTAGLAVYAFANGHFEDITPALRLPYQIGIVTSDRNQRVWVCQNTSTITKIGLTAGKFAPATVLNLSINSMPFNAASITFDMRNNLWISDDRSLYFYKNTDEQYSTASNPLFFNENFTEQPSIYIDDRDNIQVLSSPRSGNYLRTYNISEILKKVNPGISAVQITDVQLFKQPFNWQVAGFATNQLGVPQHLVLQHNQNFIKIFYAAISADYSKAVAYRYKLAAYDADWSPVTTQGEADYTGLPAGKYNFEVQARGAASTWSKTTVYSFQIKQVWYFTWWAIIMGVLSAGILGGFILYYLWRLFARRAQLRQQIVEEKLKALRAQINPHFLQNTFAFLAHEMYASGNNKAIKTIDLIATYLRNVLIFSDKTAVTLEEELEFSIEYLRLQQQIVNLSFDYTIQVADDVDTFDINVPSMLLQPTIENALKHGLDSNLPNLISINIIRTEGYIECTISDTGNGLAKNNPSIKEKTGKGIILTTDRMKLFYANKKNPPKYYSRANDKGGCDVVISIPYF